VEELGEGQVREKGRLKQVGLSERAVKFFGMV